MGRNQGTQLAKVLRISDCQALSLKGGTYLSWPDGSAPQRLREHCRWGDRNNIKVRSWGGVPWNAVFCTWRGHCIQELTVAMVICLRQAQDQAGHHSSMVGGGAQGAPPLTEELLVIDGFCGNNIVFLWECGYWWAVQGLVDGPISMCPYPLVRQH